MDALTGRMTRVTSDPADDWSPGLDAKWKRSTLCVRSFRPFQYLPKKADGQGNGKPRSYLQSRTECFRWMFRRTTVFSCFIDSTRTGRSDLWMYPLDGRMSTLWRESESSDPTPRSRRIVNTSHTHPMNPEPLRFISPRLTNLRSAAFR